MSNERPNQGPDPRLDQSPDGGLDQALSSLPRENASDHFTARVLKRAEEISTGASHRPTTSRPRSAAVRWSWALASLAVLLVAGVLWRSADPAQSVPNLTGSSAASAPTAPSDRDAARALLAELKAEHRQLTSALRQRQQEPVLYVGGDEGLDVVLDLGRTDLMPRTDPYRPASNRPRGSNAL